MRLHFTLAFALFAQACAGASHANEPIPVFETTVIKRGDAKAAAEEWGAFFSYFEGRSFGADDVLTGVAEIKPGRQIHPPHAHEEEEFLMILEGEGEWSVKGESFPAVAGDILYARPWELHGVRNTGDSVLKFVVWKWKSKDAPAPNSIDKNLTTANGETE